MSLIFRSNLCLLSVAGTRRIFPIKIQNDCNPPSNSRRVECTESTNARPFGPFFPLPAAAMTALSATPPFKS